VLLFDFNRKEPVLLVTKARPLVASLFEQLD
jgi:hypothetical protein